MTCAFFAIKNWAKFQHYKDRNPPWIKLHVEILASEDWVIIDDASKLLAVVCMIVVARHEGKVPNNPAFLRRAAYLNSAPNLKPLIDSGFLVPLADASESKQTQADARPEKETDTEGERESILSDKSDATDPKPVRKKIPYPEAFQAFWREYPTDALMSKLKAFEQWKRLSPDDQDAAFRSLASFRDFCRKDPKYRPVHVERYLNQRRFDGFNGENVVALSPEQIEANKDKADRLFGRGKYAEMQH